MSDSPTSSFSTDGSSPHVMALQVNLVSHEPNETFCHQVAPSQQGAPDDDLRWGQEAVLRRHSSDGTLVSGRGPPHSGPFHPYCRQFSDGAATLQNLPSSPLCGSNVRAFASWEHHTGGDQMSPHTYADLPAPDTSCFLSSRFPPDGASSPPHQSSSPTFSLRRTSAPSHQEVSAQTLFPKPVYSYSILIFMALKNSRAGRLPVSEIYSFMTENFPYFKTAPDGWKNSVRHNLSLNKCFEKVENKNGSSSRKGCLWALNPAKVEKMQEELHKWRRKDPQSVRRSMARPEDLDHLLGLRADQPGVSGSVRSPLHGPAPMSCPPAQQAHYSPAALQPCCFHGPAHSLLASSPPGGVTGSLYAVGHRGTHDFLLEGDATYDVDTLNPSLTDLQLQGHLWEQLRADSLASELQLSSVAATPALLPPHREAGASIGPSPAIAMAKQGGGHVGGGGGLELLGSANRLQPVLPSGPEGAARFMISRSTADL